MGRNRPHRQNPSAAVPMLYVGVSTLAEGCSSSLASWSCCSFVMSAIFPLMFFFCIVPLCSWVPCVRDQCVHLVHHFQSRPFHNFSCDSFALGAIHFHEITFFLSSSCFFSGQSLAQCPSLSHLKHFPFSLLIPLTGSLH